MNCPKCGEDWSDVAVVRNAKREGDERLREAAQAVVDEWDESLRLWLAAGEEEGDDGPAMEAIRDPERERRRVANEAALRAALAAVPVAPSPDAPGRPLCGHRQPHAPHPFSTVSEVYPDECAGWPDVPDQAVHPVPALPLSDGPDPALAGLGHKENIMSATMTSIAFDEQFDIEGTVYEVNRDPDGKPLLHVIGDLFDLSDEPEPTDG